MRQLTFIGPGSLEWREVPEPTLQGPTEALVRPIAVATCDIDGALIRGAAPFPGPFAFGHECVAEVSAVGDGVENVRVGMRVAVPFSISCGACDRCRRRVTASCASVRHGAMYGLNVAGDWGGMLSDTFRVPYADAMLVAVPDNVEATTIASISDNIPDAWRTVAPPLANRPGGDVLIVGGGARSISLYAVMIARLRGAGSVTFIDTDDLRLRLAERLGATVKEGPPPRRIGPFAITVDASSDLAGLACALRSTEPGGVCTSVGIYYQPETPVPLLEMFTYGVTFITARASSRPMMPEIIEEVAAGRLRPEQVTSRVVGWNDAIDALLETPTKLVMVPEASS